MLVLRRPAQILARCRSFGQRIDPDQKTPLATQQASGAGSPKTQLAETIVERLRRQYEILERDAKNRQSLSNLSAGVFEAEYDLTLYFDPFDYKCQRTHALLNYYSVSYSRNFHVTFLERMERHLRHDKVPGAENFQFPCMKAVLNLETEKWLFGEDSIFGYLLSENLLNMVSHKSNTAWSMQGVEFVENKVLPPLQTLFYSPLLSLEIAFYNNTDVYKLHYNKYPIKLLIWLSFKRYLKSLWTGVPAILKNRDEFVSASSRLKAALSEFGDRLGKQPYHGGQRPDEADFLLYGALKSRDMCSSFSRFLEEELPKSFTRWLFRMESACKYRELDYLANSN